MKPLVETKVININSVIIFISSGFFDLTVWIELYSNAVNVWIAFIATLEKTEVGLNYFLSIGAANEFFWALAKEQIEVVD